MKNLLKLFGIIALVAVIGFSMIACDDGSGNGGGGNSNDPTSATFTSYDAQGNSYTLVVTKNPDRAAAYSPQNGDTFVLTIRDANNAVVGTSSGSVAEVSGTTFTLENGGETFTITCSGGTIESIANPIPLDAGGTRQPPATLTPSKPNTSADDDDKTFTVKIVNLLNYNQDGTASGLNTVITEVSIYYTRAIFRDQNIAVGTDKTFTVTGTENFTSTYIIVYFDASVQIGNARWGSSSFNDITENNITLYAQIGNNSTGPVLLRTDPRNSGSNDNGGGAQ